MAFVHNFNPTLMTLGSFEIRWYGIAYVFGFLLAYLYIAWAVKKKHLNIEKEQMYDWIFYCMLGVLIGSRLIHCIFWDPIYYLTNPIKIFYLWEGGMAFHGGLIGVVVATWYFWKYTIKKKVSYWRLTDILTIPALFALAVGRIANFINGELPGKVTDWHYCWYFPGYEGCRHPQVLYSAAKRFLITGWLVFLESKNWRKLKGNKKVKSFKHKDGFISVNMLILVGLGRFIIDFWRDDPTWFFLTAGQYLSMGMIIIGGYFLFRYFTKDLMDVFR